MSGAPDTDDLAERMLARLAELDMAAAEHVQARLLAADDDKAVADLGRAYQRLGRSLRQTLALRARLAREREQDLMDAPPPARPTGAAISRRLRELRGALRRIAWTEAEREVELEAAEREEAGEAAPETRLSRTEIYGQICEDVEDVVVREMLQGGFCDEPLDDHVARLGVTLRLSPDLTEAWASLPDPPPRPILGGPAAWGAGYESSA